MDAIWWIYISLKDQQQNKGGIFDLFKLLRPKDTAKMVRNHGYWILNVSIQHLIRSNIIICWEEVVGMTNFQQWLLDLDEKPSWDSISSLATKIWMKYFVGMDFEDMWDVPDSERDQKHGNQLLFNHDGLMYSMLAHASNTGAIMIMKGLLWHWVPMFFGTGKHKYAAHISRFLWDLHLIYLLWLSWVIEQHWLCNPTGTEAGFCGIDWWVEHNNLYTKASC